MLVQSQECEWPCICVLGISVCMCFYDFIEVLVQSQECEWPCICVLGISVCLCFYDFIEVLVQNQKCEPYITVAKGNEGQMDR